MNIEIAQIGGNQPFTGISTGNALVYAPSNIYIGIATNGSSGTQFIHIEPDITTFEKRIAVCGTYPLQLSGSLKTDDSTRLAHHISAQEVTLSATRYSTPSNDNLFIPSLSETCKRMSLVSSTLRLNAPTGSGNVEICDFVTIDKASNRVDVAGSISGSIDPSSTFGVDGWFDSTDNIDRIYFADNSYTCIGAATTVVIRVDNNTISDHAYFYTNGLHLVSGVYSGNGSGLTNLDAGNISIGTLAVARGGTGSATSTGTGSVVLQTAPSIGNGGVITMDVGRGNVQFENNAYDSADGAGLTIRTQDNPTDGAILAVRSIDHGARLWVGQSITTAGMNNFHAGYSGANGQENDASKYTVAITANGIGIGKSVPSEKLDVVGKVLASAYLTQSDARLKTDLEQITDACDTLRRLTPLKYTKQVGSDYVKETGLVAQDVLKDTPELEHLVSSASDGILSVNYTGVIPYLIKAVQELSSR